MAHSAFGKSIGSFQLSGMGDVKGFPAFKGTKTPFQGLGSMMSETVGPSGVSFSKKNTNANTKKKRTR